MWHFDGSNMTYKKSCRNSEIQKSNEKLDREYHQFEFDYNFRTADDEVHCAYLVPYSYTRMQTHMYHIKHEI